MLLVLFTSLAFAQTPPVLTQDIRWGEAHSVTWSFARSQSDWQTMPLDTAVSAKCETPQTFHPLWTNSRTLKLNITPGLHPNELCSFTLATSVDPTQKVFELRAPKARILEVAKMGDDYYRLNEDDPIGIVTDYAVDPARLARNSYLEIEGLEEKVELETVPPATAAALSKLYSTRSDGHRLWLAPRRNLPTDKSLALVVSEDQTVAFTIKGRVREPFTVTASCERSMPDAPCSPFGKIYLRFTADVKTTDLAKIRLLMNGKEYAPEKSEEEYSSYVGFKTALEAESFAEVRLPDGIVDTDGRALANQSKFPLKMKIGEYPPLAKFPGAFGVLEDGKEVILPVTLRNTERPLKVQFNQTSWKSLSALNLMKWMDAVAKRQSRGWEQDLRATSVFAGTTHKLTKKELSPKLSSKDLEIVGLPLPGRGIHVVEVHSPRLGSGLIGPGSDFFVSSLVLVTNMAVHWKQGEGNALVWVTSLDSGSPVANARITVANCQGQTLASAMTGKDGVALLPDLAQKKFTCENKLTNGYNDVWVLAQTKDDFSFVRTGWNEGIESWRFDVARSYQENFLNFHAIFDRPIYQPRQAVSGLILARDFADRGLIFPTRELPKKVRFTHQGTDKSWEQAITWNDLKGASFVFKLPNEAPLGSYSVQLVESKKDTKGKSYEVSYPTGSFEVEAIKIPLMSLRLAWENKRDQFSVASPSKLAGSLHYLSGPPGADMRVTLRGELKPGYGTQFASFPEYTFANGDMKMLDENEPTIKLINQETKTNKSGAFIHELKGMERKPYLQTLLVEAEYMDPNGMLQSQYIYGKVSPSDYLVGVLASKDQDTKKSHDSFFAVTDLAGRPVPGAEVEVELIDRKWISVRKKILGGFYSYDSHYENKSLGAFCEGRTNQAGILKCSRKWEKGGYFYLQASTKDKNGQTSKCYTSVYVRGENDYWAPVEAHDRADLVPNKKEYVVGDTALFDFKTPFQESWVLLTRERKGIMSHHVMKLDRSKSAIKVAITASDAPNQFFSALAVRGRVAGATPTGTIDLGKPSMRLGLTEVKVKRPETTLEVKVTASAQVVKVREKVKARIKVSRTIGGAIPSTKLAIAVIDAGLLELKPHSTYDVTRAFAQSFSHNVDTYTTSGLIVGRRHFGLKAKPSGGDGGSRPARELFDTLLYWNPALAVNAQGEAEIEFKANDSLTEFKIMVVAYSEQLFGRSDTSFKITQDLLSFASLAPTLRIGDKTTSNFTLQNTTDRGMPLEVAYQQTNSVKKISSDKKALELPAMEAQVVSFTNMPITAAGDLNHSLEVKSKGKSVDKLVVTQKVLPLYVPDVVASDFYDLTKPVEVTAPKRLGNESHIQVMLSPSVLGSREALKAWIDDYPYQCLEQQTARLVIKRDKGTLVKYLNVLPTHQDTNGLFRYYPSESLSGSPVLTAHVLEMFHWAKLKMSDSVRVKAEQGLLRVAKGELIADYFWSSAALKSRIKLHALAVLYLTGVSNIPSQYAMSYKPNQAEDTLATLLDKWIIFHHTNRHGERDQILQDLARRFEVGSSKMELRPRPEDTDFWMLSTPVAQYARFLLQSTTLGLSEELASIYKGQEAKWLRGFAASKKFGHFGETLSNSYADLVHQYFAAATPTGKTLVNAQAHNWPTNHDAVRITGDAMFGPVKLTHQGKGVPFADVQYFAFLDPKKNVEQGFSIQRSIAYLEGKSPKIGERMKVTYQVRPHQSSTQVAMRLPLPSGVSALQVEVTGAELLYQERDFHEVRLYFDQAPSGKNITITMTLRPNQAGTFAYPGARVEEMYSAQVYGKEPDGEIVIE